jgi:NAD(P)-dependent dehydrogenase (short-subunit alcohol dehydrogenase family)
MQNNAQEKLNVRTVLITGGTSDIGREIAMVFARNGWNVLIHYRSLRKKAEEIADLIKEFKRECTLVKTDFTSEKQIRSLIDKLDNFRIDSLVNNAGTYIESKHYSELGLDLMLKTFMVNTFAPLFLSAALLDKMKQRRFGRIVNISSIAAKYGGSSYSLHYGASKRALEGLTKTLAREGAQDNVLVNTIRPGVIDTGFHKSFPKNMDKRIDMIPLKKMGTPQDVAEMVYLLGSEQNHFITNETITIAGGE